MNLGRHAPLRAAVSSPPAWRPPTSSPISLLDISQKPYTSAGFKYPWRHHAARSSCVGLSPDDAAISVEPSPLWDAVRLQHTTATPVVHTKPFPHGRHKLRSDGLASGTQRGNHAGHVKMFIARRQEYSTAASADGALGDEETSETSQHPISTTLPSDDSGHRVPRRRLVAAGRHISAVKGRDAPPVGGKVAPLTMELDLNVRRVKRSRGHAIHRQNKAAERTRRSEGPIGPSWVRVLRKMLQRTPPSTGSEHGTAEITGGREALSQLFYRIPSWSKHRLRSQRPVSRHGYGCIEVSGPRVALEQLDRLTAEFEGLSVAITPLNPASGALEKSNRDSLQGTLSSLSIRKTTGTRTANEVPLPSTWDQRILHDYVLAIVKSRKPASVALPEDNCDVAEEILFNVLFAHEASRAHLSWAVLHDALAYLVKHGKTKSVKDFIKNMKYWGFPPVTETYNIVFQGYAAEQNFLWMGKILDIMHSREVLPDGGTWLTFLSAVPTLEATQAVAKTMHRLGLSALFASAIPHASIFTTSSLRPLLDAGGDMKQFVAAMDAIYGTGWLNEDAAGQIIDGLAERGDFHSCIQVLDDLVSRRRSRREEINKLGLHKMLGHCHKQRAIDFAVWLVSNAQERWNASPVDHIVFSSLLRLSLATRSSYNTARVVWKYAACAGELPHQLRRKVTKSLEWSKDRPVPTHGERWWASFGAVLCKADHRRSPDLTPDEVLHEERDLFTTAIPARPFSAMLMKAWELDKKWSLEGRHATADTAWLVRNAIVVPMGAKAQELLKDEIRYLDIANAIRAIKATQQSDKKQQEPP